MSSLRSMNLEAFDSPIHMPTHRLHRGTVGLYASPLHRVGRLWRRYTSNPRRLRASLALIPEILRAVPEQPSLPPPTTWTALKSRWTITDVAVIAVGPEDGPPAAFVKLPASEEGLQSVRRQEAVLSLLHDETERLNGLTRLMPAPLAAGEMRGQGWIVEGAVPGVELRSLLHLPAVYTHGLTGAAHYIADLHRKTAESLLVSDAMLTHWVDAPLAVMRQLTTMLPGPGRYAPYLDTIRDELYAALIGREVQTSWIHGDYWPSNVLVSHKGDVTGIVDWERAAPDELPLHDLVHLVLHSARLESKHRDLGASVLATLSGDPLTEDEWALLRLSSFPVKPTHEGLRLMLMLYWLRYVATYLAKVPNQAQNQWWVRRNVGAVLKSL